MYKRQPLPQLTVALPNADALEDFTQIIADEVNVKEVELTADVDKVGRFEVVVNARAAGPRLGKDVQRVIKAVKSGNYTVDGAGVVTADGIELQDGEFTRKLVAADPDHTAEVSGQDGLVVLDTQTTPELEAEGWAADRVRGLQEARKAADLQVTDRIHLTLSVPADKEEWARTHAEAIAKEVLATDVKIVVGEQLSHDVADGCSADIAVAS